MVDRLSLNPNPVRALARNPAPVRAVLPRWGCLHHSRSSGGFRCPFRPTTSNFLDVLSDPAVVIGTSTPGNDPSGDYAMQLFDRIEADHPSAGRALKRRSSPLLGGRDPAPGASGAGLVAAVEVDVFVGNVSSARRHIGTSALDLVEIPARWAPRVEYGLALRTGAAPAARTLRDFLLSPLARGIMKDAGFLPRAEL